ncbi:MAG TPA: NAD-dependent epimerase/dehydratase family protein [Alphaproteobacteria bacterium]|jgi:nucleoside-diphosphate-sugar epimerase
MTRILVTGATGFVGRALVPQLIASGIDVTVAVRLQGRGAPELAGARAVAVGDIGGATDWRAALEGVDKVIHLAGVAHSGLKDSAEAEKHYANVNVAGSAALARHAATAGARRLVFLSSVKVNGERTSLDKPFSEADAPAPEDVYGRSKWQAERTLADIGRETGLEIAVLRSPLVHGPGVRGNLRSLLALCDTPLPLPFGGLTENRRSLVARDNLADVLQLCAEHPAAAGETFLIRDGEDLSTAALVALLRSALGRPARLGKVPPGLLSILGRLTGRRGLTERLTGSLRVDDAKLRRQLGWSPRIAVQSGLQSMVEAYRNL